MNKRKRYGKWEYLVRWKGYTAEKDLWEKEINLKNAKEVVEEYKKKYGKKGRRMEEENKEMSGRFIAKTLYG